MSDPPGLHPKDDLDLLRPELADVTLYKILDDDRRSPISGVRWPQRRRWTATVERLTRCKRGWHVIPGEQALLGRLQPGVIWTVEVDEALPVERYDSEWVASRARLLERTRWDERRARLFAADCAARVLPIFEAARPGDGRPRRAIEVARRFAVGEATSDERDAARDVAQSAAAYAWAAAQPYAWAARSAAQPYAWAARSAGRAAWSAAWAAEAAAWGAARDAAWSAAWAAAWAARVAAEAAAGAARVAAEAARVAAEAAAGAARDAERAWQTARLTAYLWDEQPRAGAAAREDTRMTVIEQPPGLDGEADDE